MRGAALRAAVAFCAVMPVIGCAHPVAPTAAPAQTSAGITATLTTTPSPPHTGDDTLIITLVDAQTGQPVGDANVTASAEAQSPRLPGAAASGRAQGNGVYNVPAVLGVVTSYHIRVKAERPGHATATFSFPIDAPS